MTTDPPHPLPRPLAAVQRRFEHWRATRTEPGRIPRTLWTAAVRCGAEFGVYRTVRALRLDYKTLKRRVQEASGTRLAKSPPAAFVELLTAGHGGPPECLVEIESPKGTKLRLELRGTAVPDLADLARRLSEV